MAVAETFPPVSDRVDEVELLLEGFASIVDNADAIYVSSPLTTGARAFEWHRRQPSNGSFVDDVIEPNREQAARYVRNLRKKTGSLVIDPTAVRELPGWEQSDYRYFWGRVITDYCREV